MRRARNGRRSAQGRPSTGRARPPTRSSRARSSRSARGRGRRRRPSRAQTARRRAARRRVKTRPAAPPPAPSSSSRASPRRSRPSEARSSRRRRPPRSRLRSRAQSAAAPSARSVSGFRACGSSRTGAPSAPSSPLHGSADAAPGPMSHCGPDRPGASLQLIVQMRGAPMFNFKISTLAVALVLGITALAVAPLASAKDGDVRVRGVCSQGSTVEAQAEPRGSRHRGRVRGRPEPQRRPVARDAAPERNARRLCDRQDPRARAAPSSSGASSRGREPSSPSPRGPPASAAPPAPRSDRRRRPSLVDGRSHSPSTVHQAGLQSSLCQLLHRAHGCIRGHGRSRAPSADRMASSKLVRCTPTRSQTRSSSATVGTRSPSTSGRATATLAGVTR